MLRTSNQKILDFITFPLRAVALFYDDRFGLTSLRSERFDYVAREVKGKCLDIGCGRDNLFINKFLKNKGVGIDIYPYEGLKKSNLVRNFTNLKYRKSSFSTVTFIANLNHCPEKLRDKELSEAYRVLKNKGRIVVTMGNPIAEQLVHKLVHFYDKYFKTNVDVDGERKMKHGEAYYLDDNEIVSRLLKAGFRDIKKKYFVTQWFLNHMFVARKR